MKKIILAVVFLLSMSYINAQSEKEMKAYEAHMEPGKYHEWIAQFDGEWVGESKMWMDPSKPPLESKVFTTYEMIMGGLFQRSTNKGEMMGKDFYGEGIMGFDNTSQKFVSTWIDNLGSGIIMMEGKPNTENNVLIMYGKMKDPLTGKDMKFKQVLKILNEKTHHFEMFTIVDGKEIKTMEIIYKRVK